MSQTTFGVALLGFGVVGGGVYNLLSQRGRIEAKHGFAFEVRKVLVRNLNSPKAMNLPPGVATTSIEEILSDQDIDVVVEVLAGLDPAREYITKALNAGKNVVTANKAVMGLLGDSLISKARSKGCFFGFAATVTGCYPLCQAIASSISNRRIAGIFNGTSNYILTRMEEGLPYEDALKEAQTKGYAETDPSSDVDGYDTRNKLVIVSKLAFGLFLDREVISLEGIRKIQDKDLHLAAGFGYSIKLLGLSHVHDDGRIEARVAPCLVWKHDMLAGVRYVSNGIQIYDDLRGSHGMTAEGAGSRPTANAVFADLIDMAKNNAIPWPATTQSRVRYAPTKASCSKWYLRICARNEPGGLASITRILGRHGVNISAVEQPEAKVNDTAYIALMLGPCMEKIVKKAADELALSEFLEAEPLLLKVEDDLDGLQCVAAEASTLRGEC